MSVVSISKYFQQYEQCSITGNRPRLLRNSAGYELCVNHLHMSPEKFERECLNMKATAIQNFLAHVNKDLASYQLCLKNGGDEFLKGHVAFVDQSKAIQQAIDADKKIKEFAEKILSEKGADSSSSAVS